jgi:predicted esterase
MRHFMLFLATVIGAIAAPTDDSIPLASGKHGESGGRAARFLVENLPASDKTKLSDDSHLPTVGSPGNETVGGTNDTGRHAGKAAPDIVTIGVRYFEGDQRVVGKGSLTTAAGFVLSGFETKAGTADPNDTPRLRVSPGKSYRLRFEIDSQPMETAVFTIGDDRRDIHDVRASDLTPLPFPTDENAPLSKNEAARAIALTYETWVAAQQASRTAELEAKSITLGDKTLRWLEKTFGETPPDGRSLWISMHGGGETPTRINDQQWQNQIRLYQPEEGIYLAPRAPTDKWNLWHQEHIDPLFTRLIESMVALRGVNPDRVYLMGYSAGGDGVWQLAPRMADRFAAAAMMAGHPNEASLLGLRNLPFAIFMGANDHGVNRNKVAAEKSAELAELHKKDPGGYVHLSRIYPDLGHWMNLKDAESVPWMAKFTRKTWPEKIVWFQDDVTHERFYWLRLPPGSAKKGQQITAVVDGRVIRIDGDVPSGTTVLLSDELLDLDEPVELSVNGQSTGPFQPVRTLKTIREAMEERPDPAATPSAIRVCP